MRFSSNRRSAFVAVPVALALAAGVAACGDDDDEKSGSDAKAEKVSFAVTGSGAKAKATAPKSVKAGLADITFTNDGKEPREGSLVYVDGDQTADDVLKVFATADKGIPDWLHAAGGTGTVAPGKSATVTQVLTPGRYFFIAQPDEEDAGSAAPSAEFEVTGEGTGELPATDATVTAKEYTFAASGLKPGKNKLTFENQGKELHHVIALPINKGATLEDVKEALASEEEPSGPPPFDGEAVTGTNVLDAGQAQVADLELKKGRYAFVCFIPDRKGGPPHVAKGMIVEQDIQ